MKLYAAVCIVFGVSFFLPVAELPFAHGGLREAARSSDYSQDAQELGGSALWDLLRTAYEASSDGKIVGYEATRTVWRLLWLSIEQNAPFEKILLGAWCNAANLFFVVGLLLGLCSRHHGAFTAGLMGTVSGCYWLFEDRPGELQIGYWLWLGAMCALALCGAIQSWVSPLRGRRR